MKEWTTTFGLQKDNNSESIKGRSPKILVAYEKIGENKGRSPDILVAYEKIGEIKGRSPDILVAAYEKMRNQGA